MTSKLIISAAVAMAIFLPMAMGETPVTTSSTQAAPQRNAAGQIVVTFNDAPIGKAVPSYTQGGITFSLASSPQHTRAQGRIMFFPHLKTNRRGILNAMAKEQDIPVKAQIAGEASSVTLVLWGTIGCHAWLEAHDKDGKLLDRAALPDVVPQRKSPSDPIPTFELTVKGNNIAFILFGGAPNGSALVADEVRYSPLTNSAD